MGKRIVLAIMLVFSVAAVAEEPVPAPPPPPPEVARTVAVFAGKWTMETSLTVPGQTKAMKVLESFDCKKVSAGRGVLCMESGKVPGMGAIEFTHLIAYDPERKQVHWYAVGSSGEVHDHSCVWKDASNLACDTLKATLGGLPITEEVSVAIEGKRLTMKGTQTSKDGTLAFDVSARRVGP
jgi:hypothetical protein